MTTITDVHVTRHGALKWAAHWNAGDARYHFWFDHATLEIEHGSGRKYPTIYKNPLQGIKRSDPGHFDTRYLRADATANEMVVKAVFTGIKDHNLIADAESRCELEQQKDRQATAERARISELRKAAPEIAAKRDKLKVINADLIVALQLLVEACQYNNEPSRNKMDAVRYLSRSLRDARAALAGAWPK